MLQRRLFAALVVALVAVLPLAGQEKDKEKGKDAKDSKGGDAKAAAPAPAPAPSGEKANLVWKFTKDKPFYQKMTTRTTQKMKVTNTDVQQNQNQTFYFSWTPEKQNGDLWEIKQKITGVAMDIDIGGSKITYDSTKTDAANNPLGDFFKALVGSEFTLTLDTKNMKVTKIDGRDAFLKKLTTANPQMQQLLNQILSDNALKEMAEPTFAALPNKEVAKGDSWTRESTLDMGPIGKYTNTYKYTYDGKDEQNKKLDRIKVDTTLKYEKPADNAVGGLPFKIKSANLKSDKATGTVLYDPEKGRIERSNATLDLKGDLDIEIGGQTTKVELNQTQETSVETSDTDPLAKKS
jgi:hypothetical protein